VQPVVIGDFKLSSSMDVSGMSPSLERAELLYSHERYELAERELRQRGRPRTTMMGVSFGLAFAGLSGAWVAVNNEPLGLKIAMVSLLGIYLSMRLANSVSNSQSK
jgi:hypothetical protein